MPPFTACRLGYCASSAGSLALRSALAMLHPGTEVGSSRCADNGAHEQTLEPMSGDRGPTDRSQLEDLVHRARPELRDWTDTADSDPGVALLQLFAFMGDLLSSHSERLQPRPIWAAGLETSSRSRSTDTRGIRLRTSPAPARRTLTFS